MTYVPRFQSAASTLQGLPEVEALNLGSGPGKRVSSIWQAVYDFVDKMADYNAATILHKQLSQLPDAELHRRGLSRETLARDVHASLNAP